MHGFPAALTSFIGREEAVREVAGLLDQYRLVTVTGQGGVGKTRLASRVAGQVAGRFADGAWLAGLAAVRDPAQVAAVVAAALGVREQPGVAAAETLARVLAGQQLLLVLDNCEHVIGAAAELCAGLLAACDDLRVLATSREPLAVAGEARYRLGPLTLPDGEGADAAASEAVALFADRARLADPRFVLDGPAGPAVDKIVARLDGMPLAIELAAARVEALGVAGLLDRVGDRFALLTGGDRLAADRQRSLAATVEWSYRLLTDDERRVFRAVSVFSVGFTLEGAEAVAGEGAGAVVLRLVDCSLLSPPREGPDGRPRYVMLETLRAYAAGQLAEAGEQDQAAAAALAGYALQVARQAAAGLRTTTGEALAARWLDAEDATMRQALGWAMEHDPALALRLANALGWWWSLRGRLAGQHRLLCQAASHAEVGSGGWRTAQIWLGWMAQYSADLGAALGHFTAVRDAVADRPPSPALTVALAGRAGILRLMGRAAEAASEARRALALAREIGAPAGELLALVELSLDAYYAGNHDEAVRLARQAGQIMGIPGGLARGCSAVLTGVLVSAGDLAEAERVGAAGLARARDAGDLYNQVLFLPRIVDLDLRADRIGDAAAHLREGLRLAVRTGNWFVLRIGLFQCGDLCAATGRAAEALTLWAACAGFAQREVPADPPWLAPRREDLLRQARHVLGPGRARAAEDRGAAMSMATAAEYALMLTDPGPPRSAPRPGELSARERELVTLVARGRTNAQIAAELHISVRTVGSHLDRIRDKTGCRRRADLTRLALTEGLV
jgi:predicted ATPase/DNA-binding CsgD family transcriptional regulator